MTNVPFDNITEELFRQVSYAFERTDNPSNPIKNGFLGNVGIELFQQARDTSSSDVGLFTRFLSFAIQQADLSRSQIAQDVWVDYMFEGRFGGRFLEIGAGDGVRDSNSYYLETYRHWRGVLIEPNPAHAISIRSTREADFIDKAIVADGSGSQSFAVMTDPYLSRLEGQYVSDLHDFRGGRVKEKIVTVGTIGFEELAEQYGEHGFDYISIDTEGSELELLNALPFEALQPALVTVEHNWSDNSGKIFEALASRGYEPWLAPFTRSDYFFVHRARLSKARKRLDSAEPNEAKPLLINISQPDIGYLRRQLDDASIELARTKAVSEELNHKNTEQIDALAGLTAKIEFLNAENLDLNLSFESLSEEVQSLKEDLWVAEEPKARCVQLEQANLALSQQLSDADTLLQQERLLNQASKDALTASISKATIEFSETHKRLLLLEDLQKEATEKLAQERARHALELEVATTDNNALKEQISDLKAHGKSVSGELAKLQSTIVRLEGAAEKSSAKLSHLNLIKSGLKQQVDKINRLIEKRSGEYRNFLAQRSEVELKNEVDGRDRLVALLGAVKGAFDEADRTATLDQRVLKLENIIEDKNIELAHEIAHREEQLRAVNDQIDEIKAELDLESLSAATLKRNYERASASLREDMNHLQSKLESALRGRSAAEDRVREAEGEKQAAIRDMGNTLMSSLSGKAHHDAQVILELAKRVQDLERSTSWKVTKPLRWATRLIRGR